VFVIAALLYWQSQEQGLEGFRSLPPVAGRPYNGSMDTEDPYFVPADLSKAPVAVPAAGTVPASVTRPTSIPGPAAAPRDAPASQKDLQELDTRISLWLESMAQYENDHPGFVTPDQKHQRVIYQARIATIREQLGTGMFTDTAKIVAQEITDARNENNVWKKRYPSLEELHQFGAGKSPDKFLAINEYREFRGLFDAAVAELKHHPQPDPLQRLRLQQLEVFRQDLHAVERQTPLPAIRMGAARLFLIQSLKPDQPMPTLFAMEPNPATQPKPHAECPDDIIGALQDVQWKLTVKHDPAEQELKRSVSALLDRMRISGRAMSPREIAAVRAQVAAFQTGRSPSAAPAAAPLQYYDPKDLITRARTLCVQVREAFGESDAGALGCPDVRKRTVDNEYEAETVINTVCDRIRYSVPSVDPAQFNCPRRV
jgi:hypothetical protein